ncbi:MAG: hypothetical protein QMC85_02025 [Methanocellales archaeon]|nr:hypothetical protein [Methanocellales archaeon]
MDGVTLEKIHEEVSSIKKDLNKIRAYFEGDELELSDKIKKQIVESRKKPISEMIPQGEVEKEYEF